MQPSTSVTFSAILQHVQNNLGIPISTRSIICHLVVSGFHSCRPLSHCPHTTDDTVSNTAWLDDWRECEMKLGHFLRRVTLLLVIIFVNETSIDVVTGLHL
ncbi:hypothetical protein TNIN_114601 [Trichonephila inaurata madagascariensis]|uniref:Transposase n=1 Tax=Trichonephila inaurata madagascariensis TaxID=2747483 RepID=A0A8X6XZD7_9ARAC|nr:hypothetical protein TNIN_114601 [Trichonephila inaurata madagascariensis]